MEQSGKATGVDWVKVLAWLDVNKKRVITWTTATVVVVTIVALFIYNEYQKEVRASHALSEVSLSLNPAKPPGPDTVQKLLKVEKDYPDSKAAARALLRAGGILFANGDYAEAQKLFARFEKQYPESPWLSEAQLGYAATLEMQNKTTEAVAEYEKLRKRYPTDPIAGSVKLALARLYGKQNRAEEEFALLQEIGREYPAAYSSVGAEASTMLEELLEKHPNLIKTNVPPVPMVPTNVTTTVRPSTNRPQTITLTNLVKRTNVPSTSLQITNRPGTNAPLLLTPPTNATKTITLTNLIKSTNLPAPSLQVTNRPGTNVPLLIKPTAPTPAPPTVPK